MNDNIWSGVVDVYNSDKVQAVLSAAPAQSNSIGAPEKTITVIYANGDSYKAFVDSAVKEKLKNFVEQVQTNISDLRSLGL
jgi:hypothetical protein